MPTFKIVVFQHHQRSDGKTRVLVRLTHARQSVYLKTDTYVTRKQITVDFKTIRDAEVVRLVDRNILEWERLLLRGLGANLGRYTARELAAYINRHVQTGSGTDIDFIAFSRDHVTSLRAAGRHGYAARFDWVIRALIDYFDRDRILIREISKSNLQLIEAHLAAEHTMTRTDQYGRRHTIARPGLKQQSVADFMRLVQTLFNAACAIYNESDDAALDIITHDPFRNYSVKVVDAPAKRNLSVDDIVKIVKYTAATGRTEVARDVFMLSFYFIGMNTVDLFDVEASALSDNHLTYRRTKTKNRRKDGALISIRVAPEAMTLLEKYSDPTGHRLLRLYSTYSNPHVFNSNVNKGLKAIAAAIGITPQLSTYYARHTWATMAANNCGFSDSDIAMALNHVGDKGLAVTRSYIDRDWSKIDDMNRQVLDFLSQNLKK